MNKFACVVTLFRFCKLQQALTPRTSRLESGSTHHRDPQFEFCGLKSNTVCTFDIARTEHQFSPTETVLDYLTDDVVVRRFI